MKVRVTYLVEQSPHGDLLRLKPRPTQLGGARGVMDTLVGNGLGDLSSNRGQSCLDFT